MKSVLITGIGGYIGSNLAITLSNTCHVVGIGHATRFTELKKILPRSAQLIEADILDEKSVTNAMKDIDIVIHAAGLVSERFCREYPEEAKNIIVNGSGILAKAAQAHHARIIHLSTFAVYSSYRKRPMPLTEKSKLLPDSLYGSLKTNAEKEIQFASPTILRLAHLYGKGSALPPREHKVVDMFVQAACQNQSIVIHGDGQEGLDLVHINDVTRLIKELIDRPPAPGIWNVGSGQATSVRELARLVEEEYFTLHKEHLTVRLIPEHERKKKYSRWLSIKKVRAFAPWLPSVSLRDGIREMLQHY